MAKASSIFMRQGSVNRLTARGDGHNVCIAAPISERLMLSGTANGQISMRIAAPRTDSYVGAIVQFSALPGIEGVPALAFVDSAWDWTGQTGYPNAEIAAMNRSDFNVRATHE
jgi:hypothetical protein